MLTKYVANTVTPSDKCFTRLFVLLLSSCRSQASVLKCQCISRALTIRPAQNTELLSGKYRL